jgi:hypothetical protein
MATGSPHSCRTPGHFAHCPNSDQRFASRPPAPLPRLRRWKVLQFDLTLFAIHSPLFLRPIPKTTAPLANFQLHAQLHDGFSVKTPFPRSVDLLSMMGGVMRIRQSYSGFFCPDRGFLSVFSCSFSIFSAQIWEFAHLRHVRLSWALASWRMSGKLESIYH